MDGFKLFIEKLVGLLTSQRVIMSLATIVVATIVILNVAMPLINPDFSEWDVPDVDALAAQIQTVFAQVAVLLGWLVSVVSVLFKLIGSIEKEPPALDTAWTQRRNTR